jgi:apolipoprotein N-acyltransferase
MKIVYSFLLGALTVLGFPPYKWAFGALLTIPAFFLILDNAPNKKQAFWRAFAFGYGYFVFGLYWIYNVFLDPSINLPWMIPLYFLFLPSFLALFFGCMGMVMPLIRGKIWIKYLWFSCLWVTFEWLRGHIFTGFPWNLIGYIWADHLPMLQLVSLGGIYSLSLLTMLISVIPLSVYLLIKKQQNSYVLTSIILILFASSYLWGQQRLHHETTYVSDIKLRLVQANISQGEKWQQDRIQANFEEHIRLSRSAGFDSITHVIWPETAIQYYLDCDTNCRLHIQSAIPQQGILLVGGPRVMRSDNKFMNSLYAINSKGQILATYDKFHLVPVGEYIPLKKYLPFQENLAGFADWTAGDGLHTIDIENTPPFSPLICYEAIFPSAVYDKVKRPQWLLNITNDAWYNLSNGPYQHFEITRVRAIEEGLPLVRAANTGISAVIDPYGRVLEKIDLGARGILDHSLPQSIQPTLYSQYGDDWLFILLVVSFLIASLKNVYKG